MNAVVIPQAPTVELTRQEFLNLCAEDSTFYGQQFFPKTFRQSTPAFHRDYWNKFEDPGYDFFAAEIFRGGGKTTLTRVGLSKRIAFGISRNILSVAISETMAMHTVRWIRRQMENNTFWRDTFQLRKGGKWSDDWLEIINVPLDVTISVIAKGMTSGLRGLNLDDWRPDFIQCDDISDDENTKTEDQRNKVEDLVFGAIVPGLAPKSEAPLRKFVLNQTGLHKEDPINKAHTDERFLTVKYPKLIELPNGDLQSAWPERFPTAECIAEKEAYVRKGQLHIWLREFGCKIISRETAPLDATQLKYWKSLPTDLKYFTGLDPAISKSKQAHKTAAATVGMSPSTGDIYIVATAAQKGKDPNEMWYWLKDAYRTYRSKVGCETVAFQKFLEWYFRQKMIEEKFFFEITKVNDRRPKPERIIQAYSGFASQGRLWIHENMTDFITAYTEWTEEKDSDILDAGAQAITLANPWMAVSTGSGDDGEGIEDDEKDIPDLIMEDGAP